jgi:hypothetical protein
VAVVGVAEEATQTDHGGLGSDGHDGMQSAHRRYGLEAV